MKQLKYIKVAFLFSAIALSSCDSKLDEPMELDAGSSYDYTSAEGAKSAVMGAYATLSGQKLNDKGELVDTGVAWESIPLISVRGDDVNSGGKGDQAPFGDTDNFSYDRSYWMYNSLWEQFYQKVVQVTAQIEQLEKFRAGGVNSKLIDQYIGECKTLRAFYTLEISRVWGKVIVMEVLDQSQVTLKTKDDVMKWVSSQMDESIPNLLDMRPNQRTDIKGGITKYTALAIKAMANLELKNYQGVADATGEIMRSGKFTLFGDYYGLFKTPGKLADENLLEIQYSDFGTATGNNVKHLWDFYGPTSWTPSVTSAGAGWGFYEPSLKYIKFMLNRNEQKRLVTNVLFTPDGINKIKEDPNFSTLPSWVSNVTPDNDQINNSARALFFSGKHYLPSNQLIPGRLSYGSNKNYIITRYAEILLMYAEAVARGASPTAGSAVDAVNKVRERANLGLLTSVTADQVMDEKYAELGMEWGIRYFDMVRLGNTAALSYDGRTFTMDKQFLPYPLAQLERIQSLDK
ncbi:RagB/SusD family nutrient uptake outer membrane protein [Epilithonimonas mollis]|uniref:Starch-binding associating with outer membrane n=1 Tax=Epilithonimonas mollis TaxID=216903 RepID=A0A1M6S8R9_9FLAO|nr:RagB/SusD family nutrient uptake outer membrane protein [Epilithonimonas mollis]SHK41089.1 Starch-binding associating with outer membrane [Epilithonimonas mollis]